MPDEQHGHDRPSADRFRQVRRGGKSAPEHQSDFAEPSIEDRVKLGVSNTVRHFFPPGENRQTSLWIRSATIARPSTGFLHVKESGIDSFFFEMNALRPSSMPGSISGAW